MKFGDSKRFCIAMLSTVMTMLAVAVHASQPVVTRVTYSHDIAPIMLTQCAPCHHPNSVAPFSLITYDQVQQRAQMIADVTASGYMPPWHAASHTLYRGARYLTSKQKALIQQWVVQGELQGSSSQTPPVPHFKGGWQLGKPDIIVRPSRSYHLAASGSDVYRCFVIPTNLPHYQYLSAVEIRPSDRRVVHHVIVYLDTRGVARKLEAAVHDGQPGYTSFGGPGFTPAGALGGWVPGFQTYKYAPGTGIVLPAHADIVVQVHYHKDGKPETDKTAIGLYYRRSPVKQIVRNLPLIDPFISIPAGDQDYTATAAITIPENIHVVSVLPHMHLLGRSMLVTAHFPDGKSQTLVDVPNYDFNWQTAYTFNQPVTLPAGTVVQLVAHYNNSDSNPRNPNSPPQQVWWGEQTTDEMCLAFLSYTADSENLTSGDRFTASKTMMQAVGTSIISQAFTHYDTNHDGILNQAELARMITAMRRLSGGVVGKSIPSTRLAAMAISMMDVKHQGGLTAPELQGMLSFMTNRKKSL